jgi:glucose-6-phosphate 1-dehydrogenase
VAPAVPHAVVNKLDFDSPLTFVVFGATGDLAKKKLFPALAALINQGLIPSTCKIIGYGRSEMTTEALVAKQCGNAKGTEQQKQGFFAKISYFRGGYDKDEDFVRLDAQMAAYEGAGEGQPRVLPVDPPNHLRRRVQEDKSHAESKSGYSHLVIEKPFGRDSASFAELAQATIALFRKDQLFRIDHYLGKEVVLNLQMLRFANRMFESMWNRNHIASVQYHVQGGSGHRRTGRLLRQLRHHPRHHAEPISWRWSLRPTARRRRSPSRRSGCCSAWTR